MILLGWIKVVKDCWHEKRGGVVSEVVWCDVVFSINPIINVWLRPCAASIITRGPYIGGLQIQYHFYHFLAMRQQSVDHGLHLLPAHWQLQNHVISEALVALRKMPCSGPSHHGLTNRSQLCFSGRENDQAVTNINIYYNTNNYYYYCELLLLSMDQLYEESHNID